MNDTATECRENLTNASSRMHEVLSGSYFPRIAAVILLFFAWFFIIPSNYCSYSLILSNEYRITPDLFYVLSIGAGVLGFLSAGLIAAFQKQINRLLLVTSAILLLGNIAALTLPYRTAFYFTILNYFLLGQYISFSTIFFFQTIPAKFRYLVFGGILAAIALFSAFFQTSPGGVPIRSVYLSNLSMSALVFLIILVTNLKKIPEAETLIPSDNKPLLRASFSHMYGYTFFFAIALGISAHEINMRTVYSAPVTDLIRIIPYAFAVLLLLLLAKRRNIGISIYVANASFLVSIAFVKLFNENAALPLVFALVLNSAMAVNLLFIFDTFFEICGYTKRPSLQIGIWLSLFMAGVSFGDHITVYLYSIGGVAVDRLLIILIAFISSFLPYLRLELTKLSQSGFFRIDFNMLEKGQPSITAVPGSETFDEFKMQTYRYSEIANYESLTGREREVLDLLLKGYPSELVATALYISNNTLKRHVQNIYTKLDVHTRSELFKLFQKQQS